MTERRQVVVYWRRKCSPRVAARIKRRFGMDGITIMGESVATLTDENLADFEATLSAGFLEVRYKPVPRPFMRRVGKGEADGQG